MINSIDMTGLVAILTLFYDRGGVKLLIPKMDINIYKQLMLQV